MKLPAIFLYPNRTMIPLRLIISIQTGKR